MLTNHKKMEMISLYVKDYNDFLYKTNSDILKSRGDLEKITELIKKLEAVENKIVGNIEKVLNSDVPSFLLESKIGDQTNGSES